MYTSLTTVSPLPTLPPSHLPPFPHQLGRLMLIPTLLQKENLVTIVTTYKSGKLVRQTTRHKLKQKCCMLEFLLSIPRHNSRVCLPCTNVHSAHNFNSRVQANLRNMQKCIYCKNVNVYNTIIQTFTICLTQKLYNQRNERFVLSVFVIKSHYSFHYANSLLLQSSKS